MKKSKIKYEEILDYNFIKETYNTVCRNTKHKDKLMKYDIFSSININSIYNDIKNRKYRHGKYNIFLIRDPKYRIVMSENIKDKIINHMISNKFLKPAIYPKLIEENVATRIGKGTNAAIQYCKKYFLRMNNSYEKFYILKFDITKYFYNIDHRILKEQLEKIFVDREILNILYETIDSTNYEYINDEIDKYIKREKVRLQRKNGISSRARITELNKIPHYQFGKGLGIGSLSNQIYAVFYLNGLDHYIKETLGVKEYVRFMDDGIVFSHDKNHLEKIKILIENKINELNLQMNDKTKIYNSYEGFDFVGYRFSSKNGKVLIRIKNNTKKRMKRKFSILSKHDKEKYTRVKASYKGMLKYCTSKSLYNNIVNR